MLNENILLSSLSCGSLTSTNAPEPIPGPTVSGSPASTEELFKLFMLIYIDIIKNQAQVQAPVQVPAPPIEPKEQLL